MLRPGDPDEPMARGSVLHGFRAAALDVWGDDGLRVIAEMLPDDARTASIDQIILPVAWHPVRFASAWHRAVWEGPCRRDDATLCTFVGRAVDLGFGRMRKFFLDLATPKTMFEKAPELWRYQHTHGTLVAALGDRTATLALRDHPYTRDALSRRFTAESYRYILSLCRAPSPRETHRIEGDALVVRLTWA